MNKDSQNSIRKEKSRTWFRPTFSIRTMLVAIAVVTAYFVLWDATKQNGMETRKARKCPMPFLIVEYGPPSFGVVGKLNDPFRFRQERRFYLWFFCEPMLIAQREMQNKLDSGLTATQRRQKMKEIARAYGKLIRRPWIGMITNKHLTSGSDVGT